ncbi:hypothetical protein CDAR_59961 [Caerostris darwini]|uniref:Uncharacterized protein n=1 Tax=Caerostris darwini TaxID=1538125 RepID=A0AAV4RTS1_9ARAC|nr:hypothetical protein CDAR_59961 [Caerostris darwini]
MFRRVYPVEIPSRLSLLQERSVTPHLTFSVTICGDSVHSSAIISKGVQPVGLWLFSTGLTDMSTINAHMLEYGYSPNPVMTRMVFLKGLAKEIVILLLHRRVKNLRNRGVSLMIKRILGKEEESKNVE